MTASAYTGFEQVIIRQSPTAPPSAAERIEQRKRDYAAYQKRRRDLDAAADAVRAGHCIDMHRLPADGERRAYWRHEAGLDGNGHGARTW